MAVGLEFYHSCMNCYGKNTDVRNLKGLPCEACLPDESADVYKYLVNSGNLKNYKKLHEFKEKYKEVENFFEEKLGVKPNGFQRLWIKRVLLNKSFTAIAPTGMGKTTFGVLSSLYFEKKKKKVLLVLPTVLLVNQIYEKLKQLGSKKVLKYTSKLPPKEKKENLDKIKEGKFNVLAVSTQFISRNFEYIKDKKFDFIFVDDVDAILKSSKNIDKILLLLGIDKVTIEKAYRNILGRRNEKVNVKNVGVLVVSSATAKPKGLRHYLFREILGFDIGSLVVSSRNITNVRVKAKDYKNLKKVLDILKDGVILFFNAKEELSEVVNRLKEESYNIESVISSEEKVIENFKEGKINIVAGVSSYYGKLVRGIDIPERIKAVVFYGTPHFEFNLEKEKAPGFVLKKVLKEFIDHGETFKKMFYSIDKVKSLDEFRKKISISDEEWLEKAREVFSQFEIKDNKVLVPDVLTYIQGSGRASRFTKGGLTKGISVLLEDNDKLFEILKERLEWLVEEDWKDFEEVDWNKELEEVILTRQRKDEKSYDFKSVLFIVESPTKASTISSFFGRLSSRKYEGIYAYESVYDNNIVIFTATRGHVYDLVTDEGFHGVKVQESFIPVYTTIKRCKSCGYQFTTDSSVCPICGSEDIDDKTAVIKSLRDIALEVDEVLVATDPDTEGEKISYDVIQYIKPVNGNVKRLALHEITRQEFKRRFQSPGNYNEDLVKAQVVRRVQDRWVGFELSQIVQQRFKNRQLSAGRVQSTVLGWIVEREKEYKESEKQFTSFKINGRNLEAEGKIEESKAYVEIVEEIEDILNPLPPYTTDSALSEISSRYKYHVAEIMSILQDLFEHGFITYHRTDSTRISDVGKNIAKKIFERMNLLEIYRARGWLGGGEGAHEAIRPAKAVSPDEIEEMIYEGILKGITRKHINVYRMIYERFLQSQSKAVKVKKQRVRIKFGNSQIEDEVIKKIIEDGWNLIKPVETFHYKAGWAKVENIKHYKKHTVPLYTQAKIIEEMKSRKIGRPSTYAKIVEILFKRGYIKEDKYNRLWPTALGKRVYEFLKENYTKFVTDETTRKLEEMMDKVERAEIDYMEVLKSIYEDAITIKNK
ncbi:MAG: reverse gyrase [Thermotogaceae bacterium]|nr:reverse gyrase [Thermotogaceae bacterium]